MALSNLKAWAPMKQRLQHAVPPAAQLTSLLRKHPRLAEQQKHPQPVAQQKHLRHAEQQTSLLKKHLRLAAQLTSNLSELT